MIDKIIDGLVGRFSSYKKETVTVCLELFKLRFNSDYEAIINGKEYPLSYFSEWCSRLETGNVFGYADLETARCLRKVGVKE